MLVQRCDGSPASVHRLSDAVAAALRGADTVLPLGNDDSPLLADAGQPPSGTAVVIATSGSTGKPKGVLLSGAALRASASATHARLGGPGRWLLALPAQHVAGLQVLVRSLLAGVAPAVYDLGDGFEPERFRAEGCRYTALVPTQLVRLLDAGGSGLAALREFDAVLLGGASTPPELRARAEEAGVRVVTTYGMSETAGGCVYDGVPLDGVRVRVAAENGSGPLELGGPTLATGYLGQPELTGRVFADGWFRTGDLGRLTEHGRVQVLGRADDVIITGGVKVAPEVVERALRAQPGVRDACVVGVPDDEWGQVVGAVVVAGAPFDRDALLAGVRAALGGPATPKILRALDVLPLRGIGKPDRQAVRRLLGPS
ncbi:o-succinylbenzoate--CoA ligase [Amycolatopsis nigrescens]|uniref:o-succinylbenzoate--CoA ligase n=1 Tax=Amycolatopsis nigrescens TaxID=381445 RepID=UPI00036169FA|nr:o-succinylbenzoate--CoA ligase [Amycolatopsis nigrescens]